MPKCRVRGKAGTWDLIGIAVDEKDPGGKYYLVIDKRGRMAKVRKDLVTGLDKKRDAKSGGVKKNPSSEALESAKRTYEGFHWGNRPTRVRKQRVSVPRGPLVEIGTLVAVEYETAKGGKKSHVYRHEMGEDSGVKPKLAFDKKKKLHIVGGRYKIEDRGIVD